METTRVLRVQRRDRRAVKRVVKAGKFFPGIPNLKFKLFRRDRLDADGWVTITAVYEFAPPKRRPAMRATEESMAEWRRREYSIKETP